VFGWPSGLRRWFKAPVSSGAWVRIPLRTLLFGHLRGVVSRCYLVTGIGIVRSYHGESTRSHPNSEVKHHWACSVLRWGTTRESQVAYVLPCLWWLYGSQVVLYCSYKCAIGLVVKYFVANEVPRVRFPDGAYSAFVAQLAARGSHNPKVAGSTPVESIFLWSTQLLSWPSGLRRSTQVRVHPVGVGSNPTGSITFSRSLTATLFPWPNG
jgi:hypothetical protein